MPVLRINLQEMEKGSVFLVFWVHIRVLKAHYIKVSVNFIIYVFCFHFLYSVCPCLFSINWLYLNSSVAQPNFIRISMSVYGQGQMITHRRWHATLPP